MEQTPDRLRDYQCQTDNTNPGAPGSDTGPDGSLSDTVELEPYMKAALLKAYKETPSSIFRPSKTFSTPSLRRDVVNRILLFRGSFNPPHIGHKVLLTHTFLRAALPNVVAAIVVSSPMKDLEKKMRNEVEQHGTGALLLSRAQRAALWQDDAIMKWTWVSSSEHRFRRMESALTEPTSQDGFEIEFVVLAGGENALTYAEERPESSRKVPDIVFSKAMRTFDVFNEDGKPKAVRYYGEWSTTDEGDRRLLEKIRQGSVCASEALALLYPHEARLMKSPFSGAEALTEDAVLQHLTSCLDAGGPSWICQSDRNPHASLQYIPGGKVASVDPDISSTQIRQLIRETPVHQRLVTIAGLTLNAELLLKLVRQKEVIASEHEEELLQG